jgi:hypothetical protein
MRSALTRDLARWERGGLSAAELELQHPGRTAGLVAMYERLSDLSAYPVPNAEAEWDRLQERLPDHPVAAAGSARAPFDLRRLVFRPMALAATLVLLGGAIAYAVAPEAVNRRLASVWESLEDLVGGDTSEDLPTRFPGGEQRGVAPLESYRDYGNLGQSRTGDTDRDRREGHDEERKSSDEDSGGDSIRSGGDDGGSSGDDGSGGSSGNAGTGGSGGSDRADGSGGLVGRGSSGGSVGSGGSSDSGGDDGGSGGDDGSSGSGGDDGGDDGGDG